MSKSTIRVLRCRVKDKHAALLRQQARSVNTVWNFCNELSIKHFDRQRKFLSAYDMQPYTKGSGEALGLHSQTIQGIQEEYCSRRKQFKKIRLSWRKSGGVHRSLVVRSVKPYTIHSNRRIGLPKRTTLLDPIRDHVSRKIHVRR